MEEKGWNLFIEVTKRIDKTLRWTLGRYEFDVTLDSPSILSTTILYQNSLILSVTIFKNKEDIQISISSNKENTHDNDNEECKKTFTYTLNNLNEPVPKLSKEDKEFKRFMKFTESVSKDLDAIGNDDIDLFYIYIIFPLIFPKAMEIGEDYLVEAIIDKCITYYNDNYSKCSPNILSIITTSYSKLCDIYPHYAKKFISTLTIYHNLKIGITDKKHLESYSDRTKNSKLFKLATLKINIHFFHCLLLEFSFITTLVILNAIFYMYNTLNENVTISLSLVGSVILFMTVPQEVPSKIRRSSVELFIPTKFTSYPEPTKLTRSNFLKKLFLIPTSDELSEFVRNQYPYDYSVVSERQARDLYSSWNGEALINFKWNHFAKFYYFINLLVYIIFTFFFYLLNPFQGNPLQIDAILIIEIILGFFLFSFEVRKFIFNHKKYIWSEINFINLGAYIFPTVSCILYLVKISPPVWVLSTSITLLDVKMILFLSPFKIFGSYLTIIRYVARRVFSFLLILFFLILAFADAFHLLLRPNNSFDVSRPLFDNDPNNPWNLVSTYYSISPDQNIAKDPSLTQLPNTNTNVFTRYNTTVLALYQLMTGNSNSLDSFELNQNPILVITWTFYSFLVVIYLLNLFIGLLNNAIQEVGQEFFLFQKAEMIAEIELFWLFPFQRRWKEWFPDHIRYNVYVDDLRKKIQEIQDLNKSDKPIIHPELLNLIGMQEQDDEKEFYLKEIQILRDEKKILLAMLGMQKQDDEKKIDSNEEQILPVILEKNKAQ